MHKLTFSYLLAYVLTLVGLLNSSCEALNEKTHTFSQGELIAEVLEKNPEIDRYRSEIDAAKGERAAAAVYSNPELGTTIGNKRVPGELGSDNGASWEISLDQTFEWGDRISLRKKIADKQVALAEVGLEQFKNALTFKTKSVLFEISQSKEKREAVREITDRYRKLREVLQKREIAGINPLLEKRIIEAQTMSLEHLSADSDLESQRSILELNALRGAPLDTPLSIEPMSFELPEPPNIEILQAAAREKNFSFLLKKGELEQQRFKVDLAKNERYPAYSVGPYLSKEHAGGVETQVGISFSMPLAIWNDNSGKISVEQARQNQLAASLAALERELERKIAENFHSYAIKRAEMERWSAWRLEEFKDAASLSEEHYRSGSVPVSTFIEVQKQYLETVESAISVKREALSAWYELEQTSGVTFGELG